MDRPHLVVGLDNFPKVLEVLGLSDPNPLEIEEGESAIIALRKRSISPANIASAGKVACSQNWEQLLLNLPGENQPSYRAQRACYGSAFIYTLLISVYNMPEDSQEFVPLEALTPFGELGWALGMATLLSSNSTIS